MAIYVDNMRAPFGRMILCHLLADTDEELLSVAKALGLKPAWRHGDHFDICLSKRAQAIRLGAIEITLREACRIRIARRGGAGAEALLRLLP